jgi:hypothetical protein
VDVIVTPEPSEDERAAILAALAEEEPPKPPAPWLGDDQEP